MSTTMDHQFLDTYDGNTGPDQFSFPVSALEQEVLSNMGPRDLLPFGQDIEGLDVDLDIQDKSCLPQASFSSSLIQVISPLETLFPAPKLPLKYGSPESFPPEQVWALNDRVVLKAKTC